MKQTRTLAMLQAAAAAALLATAFPPARAADGLEMHNIVPDGSDHWRGRLSLSIPSKISPWDTPTGSARYTRNQATSASIVADYYFFNPSSAGRTTGFRASGGIGFAQRGAAWLGRMPLGASTAPSGVGLAPPLPGDGSQSTASFPYIGIGYSGLYDKSGWGFTADLGLMGLSSTYGNGYGLKVDGGATPGGLDSLTRMRPVVQVGVSYSF